MQQNDMQTMQYECRDCGQSCETQWQINEKQTAAKRRSVCCSAPVTTRSTAEAK